MVDNERARRNARDDEERTIDESKLREKPDYLQSIGPEDENPQVIENELEDFWGNLDEDDFVSQPTLPSDMPDWSDGDTHPSPLQDDYERRIERSSIERIRPVEDEVIDEMDGRKD